MDGIWFDQKGFITDLSLINLQHQLREKARDPTTPYDTLINTLHYFYFFFLLTFMTRAVIVQLKDENKEKLNKDITADLKWYNFMLVIFNI